MVLRMANWINPRGTDPGLIIDKPLRGVQLRPDQKTEDTLAAL